MISRLPFRFRQHKGGLHRPDIRQRRQPVQKKVIVSMHILDDHPEQEIRLPRQLTTFHNLGKLDDLSLKAA